MNEFENKVYNALLKKYNTTENSHKVVEWVIFKQLKVNTGIVQCYGGSRYIDFFIMNMLPSKNYKSIGIEVKQSMDDLRNDWLDCNKQVAARFYSDEFYYLITDEMDRLNKKEITNYFFKSKCTDGLMIYTEKTNTIRIAKKNKTQEKSPFSFGFIASLIRNVQKTTKGK